MEMNARRSLARYAVTVAPLSRWMMDGWLRIWRGQIIPWTDKGGGRGATEAGTGAEGGDLKAASSDWTYSQRICSDLAAGHPTALPNPPRIRGGLGPPPQLRWCRHFARRER